MVVRELLVAREVNKLRESFLAEVAGEWLLAGVDEGVALQLGRRREVLAALLACMIHFQSLVDTSTHFYDVFLLHKTCSCFQPHVNTKQP